MQIDPIKISIPRENLFRAKEILVACEEQVSRAALLCTSAHHRSEAHSLCSRLANLISQVEYELKTGNRE